MNQLFSAQAPSQSRSNRFVIIMAGGRGERFWPVSREKTPKQLITLFGHGSFLQQAVERVLLLVPRENIIIITNTHQAAAVRKQLTMIPKTNVLGEPCGRDTCAAVTLGAAVVAARNPNGVMAVLPADHVIPHPRKLQQTLKDSWVVAARDQCIVTIGIKPTEPATGYGYIQVGPPIPPPTKAQKLKTPFNKVLRFVEKPPLEKAVEYLASGQYRWNAGMFVWSVATIANGLKAHQPGMHKVFEEWTEAAQSPAKLQDKIESDYPNLPKISIDYALLEHATDVAVADGAFAWDDLGAWNALARHTPLDSSGNTKLDHFIHIDASNNILFDARTKNRTPITAVGVNNLIMVHTDDAILVASKADSQKIKELVKKLASDPKTKHLV